MLEPGSCGFVSPYHAHTAKGGFSRALHLVRPVDSTTCSVHPGGKCSTASTTHERPNALAGPADRLHGVLREEAETVLFLWTFQGRRGLTLAPVGRRDHATHVELARRLCAAYVSFRMRRRGIDSVLPHMPKTIGHFWIELARLVTLQRRTSAPDENDEMPKDRSNTRGAVELPDEGDHTSVKTRAKRSASKKIPHSREKRPT